MGNLIFGTTTIQGRTFDDIKIQTSKAGVPRPIVFGRARPIIGNIIATTEPRIVTTTEEQEGGKGGPSVEVENEEVYRTYAIRICEGPVTGVRRVWRNNEIVYDRDSDDPVQIENNDAFLEKAEFFLGGFDQMPSAVMEAAFGIGNVHAYRGTCYIVVDDDNLTGSGGAIPQYQFEVERCEGFVVTSRPYALENSESLGVSPSVVNFNEPIETPPENLSINPGVDAITLRDLVNEYSPDPEGMSIQPDVDAIEIKTVLQQYDAEHEPLSIEPSIEAVSVKVVVVNYETEPETLDIEPGIDAIEITTP